MKAIRFEFSLSRYVTAKLLGRWRPSAYWGSFGCLRYCDVDMPALPGDDWARVRVRYGGICATDMATVTLKTSPTFAPFNSTSFTLGHENVGTVDALGPRVDGFSPGQRVVVDPVLSCEPRGFDDLCPACAAGRISQCHRFTMGRLAAGFITGACRDTGGSWSPYLVAHRSQLVAVPDHVSDENAVLVEPFAVCLSPVLRYHPDDGATVLIIGSGVIGLLTLAALRAVGCRCRVIVVARHDFQAAAARRLGADEVVRGKGIDLYRQLSTMFGSRMMQPPVGKPILDDGPDIVFECAGTSEAVDDALRLAGRGARVILLGMPALAPGVDWTPISIKELNVVGSFLSGSHRREGKVVRTSQIAMELLADGRVDLGWMVTHRFPLRDYEKAFTTVLARGREGVIKAVFDFTEAGTGS